MTLYNNIEKLYIIYYSFALTLSSKRYYIMYLCIKNVRYMMLLKLLRLKILFFLPKEIHRIC